METRDKSRKNTADPNDPQGAEANASGRKQSEKTK